LFYFYAICCGYLVGSLPTAYLIVKLATGVDVRGAGSGNVGGFNAFQVTESKRIGIAVSVIDGLKGMFAAGLAWWFFPADAWMQIAGSLGAILGHNYSIWLGFKGGRGLATAAGISFVTGLSFTIVWCLTWFVSYRFNRDILKSNLIATVLLPIIIWLAPVAFIERTTIRSALLPTDIRLATAFLATLLLVSHHDAIRDLLKRGRNE
jgi:glycerol-3-phosphate acyltransferase PlsY